MDQYQYKLGRIKSPDDPRDFSVTRLAPMGNTFPDTFQLECKIKDQGNVGSCVAHSLALSREITEKQQAANVKAFSVAFLYGNREATDHQGEGMIPRQALNSLLKQGAVHVEDFPGNFEYPQAKAQLATKKVELFAKAYPNRITAYARLYTITDIKTALMKLGPVTFGMDLYSSFYKIGYDGIMPVPSTGGEEEVGGHQMTIVGWKPLNGMEHLIVANSWGERWGDHGYCYIPVSVLRLPIWEAWSMTDTVVPTPVPIEPTPVTPLPVSPLPVNPLPVEPLPAEPVPVVSKFYRVLVDISTVRSTAFARMTKLRGQGHKAYVDQFDGYYLIMAGDFATEEEALRASKVLAIPTKIIYG